MGPAPLAAGPGGAARPTLVTPIEGPLGPPMYPIDGGAELPVSAVLTGTAGPPSRLPDPIVSGCFAPLRSSRTKEMAASGPVPGGPEPPNHAPNGSPCGRGRPRQGGSRPETGDCNLTRQNTLCSGKAAGQSRFDRRQF